MRADSTPKAFPEKAGGCRASRPSRNFGVRSPTVVLFVAQDDEGVLWVCDEIVRTDSMLDDLARATADGNAAACA